MKSFLKSRTLWFNVLYLVVILAGAFGFKDFQPSSTVVEIGFVLPLIVNIGLRFVTKQAVSLTIKK